MDRKYRQRGYMSEDKEPRPRAAPQQKSDMRAPNIPALVEVTRCSLCGMQVRVELGGIPLDSKCPKCQADLHVCKNCVSFDPGARFQCRKPVSVRIPKKDVRNECELFEPRKTLERQTTSAAVDGKDPRSAFDRLFKK
jgi:hypothetical protein